MRKVVGGILILSGVIATLKFGGCSVGFIVSFLGIITIIAVGVWLFEN